MLLLVASLQSYFLIIVLNLKAFGLTKIFDFSLIGQLNLILTNCATPELVVKIMLFDVSL